jgi:hypothetical protein
MKSNKLVEKAKARNAALRSAAPNAPIGVSSDSPRPDDVCAKCGHRAVNGQEDSSGSSTAWFACDRCGHRWRSTRRSRPE